MSERGPILALAFLAAAIGACGGDDDGSGVPMVDIPAGPFLMGCNPDTDPSCATDPSTDDEKPLRTITLSAYRIDLTEVTQAAYAECVDSGACLTPSCAWDPTGRPNDAVACVTMDDARAYCQFAGKMLPTEAQWEKAARGVDGRLYPWGGAPPSCNLVDRGCGSGFTVGQHPDGASPFGVLDMAGNLAEIVNDFYDVYAPDPETDPTGPPGGSSRVLRGGSSDSPDSDLRTSSRNIVDPAQASTTIGFRCASR